MKNIIVILLLTICSTSNLSAENIQKKRPAARASTSMSKERQILERDCQLLIARINEYYTCMGGRRSSARDNAVRDNITQYLRSKGTPTAMQLLRTYEELGWKNV